MPTYVAADPATAGVAYSAQHHAGPVTRDPGEPLDLALLSAGSDDSRRGQPKMKVSSPRGSTATKQPDRLFDVPVMHAVTVQREPVFRFDKGRVFSRERGMAVRGPVRNSVVRSRRRETVQANLADPGHTPTPVVHHLSDSTVIRSASCSVQAVRLLARPPTCLASKSWSGRGAQTRATAADRPTPVSRRDGFRLTLPQESRIGLTVVAHHHGPLAEMNHLHHVRVTRRCSCMVVIPPVHRRCRARSNEERALLSGTPVHDPSHRSAALRSVQHSPLTLTRRAFPATGLAEDVSAGVQGNRYLALAS